MTARASFSLAVHTNLPRTVTVSLTRTTYSRSGHAKPELLVVKHVPWSSLEQSVQRLADLMLQRLDHELAELEQERADLASAAEESGLVADGGRADDVS